jgi:TPR repeat protein
MASACLAALVLAGGLAGPARAGGDETQPYPSATEAYREGASALKAGHPAEALPPLEYAAKRGVLGAQLKLARAYAAGRDVRKDDIKAFYYYQQIADQYADISPSSPVAKYVGEAFVALGRYYLDGIPAMPLASAPAHAARLFRHAASYFGSAEAQYQLALLYLDGNGVEKSTGLAVNWLVAASRKQHASSQATLGRLLWRGEEIRQRRARGLALVTLAHKNAQASGNEPQWIADLYQECLAGSDKTIRQEAEALLPQLGDVQSAAAAALEEPKAKPTEVVVIPPAGLPDTTTAAATVPADIGTKAPPPAPIGLSVGFGGTSAGSEPASGFKP